MVGPLAFGWRDVAGGGRGGELIRSGIGVKCTQSGLVGAIVGKLPRWRRHVGGETAWSVSSLRVTYR